MANILQDIWIINFSGIVLYYRSYNKKIDAQLFGGLMSAISKLAESISDTSITSIAFGNKSYGVLKKENILFIANSNEDIDSKTINYELKIIAYKFLNLYRDLLKNEELIDISPFFDFTGEIKSSLMITKNKNASPIYSPGKDLPEFSEWIRNIRSLSNQKPKLISPVKPNSKKIREPVKLEKHIISLFKNQNILKTQQMIIDKILPIATNQNVIITAINNLKEKKVINYSKKAPKGWRLAS